METATWFMKLIVDENPEPTIEPFFSIYLIIGSILCFLAGALCAGGGIGGGAFYIPVFVLVLGLDPHVAVPLSKVTTFGIAIGGYIVNCRKRHPNLNRPLIYYDLAMLMEPTTLIGTVIGVYLNVMSPAYIILVCLLLLLTWTSYETLKKAWSTYKNEVKEELQAKEVEKEVEMEGLIENQSPFSIGDEDDDVDDVSANNSSILIETNNNNIDDNNININNNNIDNSVNNNIDNNNNVNNYESENKVEGISGFEEEYGVDCTSLNEFEKNSKREEIIAAETKTPFLKLLLLFLVWAGFLVLILLKGGSGDASIIGVMCGTLYYWLIVLAEVPYLLGFAAIYGIYLRYKNSEKEEVEYEFQKGDIKWTKWNTTWLPIASILAGVAAGFLGIGGGMVKGPIMLAINVIPQVATATSAFMIMFTASATSIQFMILGKLPLNYAIWYFFVGIFAAIVGQMGLAAIVKKYKKQSLVGFLLGICIVLSAVAMAGMIILDMIEGTANLSFQGICEGDTSA